MKRTLGVLFALALAIPFAVQASAASSGQVVINGNGGFLTCGCVSGGDGSPGNPYVIGPLTISADSAPAVSISNTTRSFTLLHLNVHVTGSADGILFTNVSGPASITQVNVDGPPSGGGGGGIHLVNSSKVAISGDSVNSMQGWGIKVERSSQTTISFMTVAHNGLSNPDSTESAAVSPNPFLAGITGDAPGGVLLRGGHDNTLTDSLLNEDAYAGFELVGETGDMVSKIHVRYPDYFGGVLQSVMNSKLDGVSLQTADFDGLLMRASNGNTITDSTFSANGPIGNEWNAKVVPYFIAGAYVGWGSSTNRFTADNGNFGNTGPDLVIDDGTLLPGAGFVIHGVNQTVQPLNQPSTYTTLGVSMAAGSGNVACGNSFAAGYWYPSSLNANSSCP